MDRNLLLLDVGNTNLKWLITPFSEYKPLFTGTITVENLAAIKTELRSVVKEYLPFKTLVASVKPSLNQHLKKVLPQPHFVKVEEVEPFLKIEYQKNTIGIDRLLNALGGLNYTDTFVVISCGTATVIDIVQNQTFKGGNILPGIKIQLESLSLKTEKIPSIREVDFNYIQIPAKNTRDAIISGIIASHLFTLKEFIEYIYAKDGLKTFIFTGGLAEPLMELLMQNYSNLREKYNLILIKDLLFKGLYRLID